MNAFDAGTFTDITNGQSQLANDIWGFLNSRVAITAMLTATILTRPALEPLQNDLFALFGTPVSDDRVKQMMGRMCKQILLEHGCTLDRTGVKIRTGNLFTTAARYKQETDWLLSKIV